MYARHELKQVGKHIKNAIESAVKLGNSTFAHLWKKEKTVFAQHDRSLVIGYCSIAVSEHYNFCSFIHIELEWCILHAHSSERFSSFGKPFKSSFLNFIIEITRVRRMTDSLPWKCSYVRRKWFLQKPVSGSARLRLFS